MLRYVAYRIGLAIPLFLGAALLIFLAGHLAPGDPVETMLGDRYNPGTAAVLRHQIGLDRPLTVQFGHYVAGLAHLDFGTSYVNPSLRVSDLVGHALPISLRLATLAVLVAALAGTLLGVAASTTRWPLVDHAIQVGVVLGLSVPSFVTAAVLVYLFALRWPVLPVAGWGLPENYVLPVAVLSIAPLAFIARIARSSVGQVLLEDYVRTARGKGLKARRVLVRHVLRNAALPVVTTIGLAFGNAIVGAFVVEILFNIPGIARVAINAILQRDYTVLQAAVLVYTGLFSIVNLAVDVSYAYLNPRIRY
ncbi:MAG TPA: ABC transporter permease [bacterium]|nr:ABC transporter permease [bacterium]